MQNSPRYAVYFMPQVDSGLWRFGSQVIGYNATDPLRSVLAPDDPFAVAREAGAFADPARYGFHATLKAPFELAAGITEDGLLRAARAFAASAIPFPLGRLRVARLRHFLALVPVSPPPALEALAARCVEEFDSFRAPLSAADRARRLQSPLPATELANLDRWGYPYVFEQFNFHMTLTGPLPAGQIEVIEAQLSAIYRPVDDDVLLDGIAIFKQPDRASRFCVVERMAFFRKPAIY